MIFAVGYMQFETLQLKTCTSREACPVRGGSIVVANLHLVGLTEVIPRSDIDITPQEDIGSDSDMTSETFAPVVEPTECGRETERGLSNTFGGTDLQVKGDALKMVIVGFDLSSQIACHCRETEVVVFVEIVETQIHCHCQSIVSRNIGGDELCCDTTTQQVGECVGKSAANGNVTC